MGDPLAFGQPRPPKEVFVPFASALRRRVRQGLGTALWALRDLPGAPTFEIFARRLDRMNRAHVAEIRSRGGEPMTPRAPDTIPKIVWIYWAQGLDEAPPVVQRCIASWRAANPDWDLQVLDRDAAGALVDLSDLPAALPRRHEADFLRLRLLERFGGIWADATVFCHRPLQDWLPLLAGSGFFVFRDPGPDRWLSTWFIAAAPGHPLIAAWVRQYGEYLIARRRPPGPYFMVMYAFQFAVSRSPELMREWRCCSGLWAVPSFRLMAALDGQVGAEEAAVESLRRGLPVSKLNWKKPFDQVRFDTILGAAGVKRDVG